MTAFLHIANGTSTTRTIHDAGIPGRSSIWADPLHEGPVPGDLSDEELLSVRASHLADEDHGAEAVASEMRGWREVIDDHHAYDEVVLWYEHDLFDQLNLIQVLSRLAGHGTWPRPVSLICIGSFPGRPRFRGLGELTAGELAPLFDTRQPVTAAQYLLAAQAWSAFRSAEPTAIEAVLAMDTSALPYLGTALDRYLEDFPSVEDGLSRTERRLAEIAAPSAISLRAAFPLMHEEETAFYIDDVSFLHVARELAAEPSPVLTISAEPGAKPAFGGTIELTEFGRAVLARRADAVEERGIDRWLGGVYLTGAGPHWRWDRGHERLVRV